MGEAKRNEGQAIADGRAPKAPLTLEVSDNCRVHELQTRMEAARAVALWAVQQADAAAAAFQRECTRLLEDNEVEVPAEETPVRWNHNPRRRTLSWLFLRAAAQPPPSPPSPSPPAAPGRTETAAETSPPAPGS